MNKQIIIHDKAFELFIPEAEIKKKIKEIAEKINKEYKYKNLFFVVVLNGGFIFASDLVREVELQCGISFVRFTSYKGKVSSGNVSQLIGLTDVVNDKDVIILEDIIDSGSTLKYLLNKFNDYKPLSLKIAALLYKTNPIIPKEDICYTGFEIPADFVVGYGLDYMESGRNLRDIYVMK